MFFQSFDLRLVKFRLVGVGVLTLFKRDQAATKQVDNNERSVS